MYLLYKMGIGHTGRVGRKNIKKGIGEGILLFGYMNYMLYTMCEKKMFNK